MAIAHGEGTSSDIGEPKLHGSGSGSNRSWLRSLDGRIRSRWHNVSQKREIFCGSIQVVWLDLSALLKLLLMPAPASDPQPSSSPSGRGLLMILHGGAIQHILT